MYKRQACGEDFSHYYKVIQNLVAIITHKIVFQCNKVYYLCTTSSQMRLKKYLLDCTVLQQSNQVHIPFTQEELASYLGISRPVLSKDLSALKRKGIIRLDREWVTVLDLSLIHI